MKHIILFGLCLIMLSACGIIKRAVPKRPTVVVTENTKPHTTQTSEQKATFF